MPYLAAAGNPIACPRVTPTPCPAPRPSLPPFLMLQTKVSSTDLSTSLEYIDVSSGRGHKASRVHFLQKVARQLRGSSGWDSGE